LNNPQAIFLLAAMLMAVGIWLMLPRGLARGWMTGIVIGSAGLGLLVAQLPGVGGWVASILFFVLAAVTVLSAVAAITLRNPVYAAVWFGMTLLGTAGLFFYQGAQFLAVATIVVYAGAILVTFLFVLMLAQPQGRAYYDRVSWEAVVSATTGSVIVGILAMTVTSALADRDYLPPQAAMAYAERRQQILAEDHVARLGQQLFGPHLIAVEVAGTLLLAALIGAAVIVARSPSAPSRPGSAPPGKEEGRDADG